MGNYTINRTGEFYTGNKVSLFWETTICRSLADPASPYAGALEKSATYGDLLGAYLSSRLNMGEVASILEIGGGEGTLMERLIAGHDDARLTMVDISARFSALQESRLRGRANSSFVVADIFDWLSSSGEMFDLVIANENIGDFTTVIFESGADAKAAAGELDGSSEPGRAVRLVEEYGLALPDEGEAAVNLGALELVAALAGRTRALFLSEHSANAVSAPPYDFLTPLADGRPRRIKLKDHDEYSINFDHVEKVARVVGFNVERVWMPVFLGVRSDAGARFVAGAECVGNERAEVLHEFLHHVKEYECLLLTSP